MKIFFTDWWTQIKTSLLGIRQQRPYIIILIIAGLAILIGLLWLVLQPPAPKPLPPAPPPKVEKPPTEDYLICVARGQITTGYTEPSGGPPASSGKGYNLGSVAVHPRVPTQWGGDPRIPIIPFGTALHLLDPTAINIYGKWYDTLYVNDTGDINLGLWAGYPYWFDIYYGDTGYWTNRAARAYGTRKVDYYWVEKWR